MSEFLVCVGPSKRALTIKQLKPVQQVFSGRFGHPQTLLTNGVGCVVDQFSPSAVVPSPLPLQIDSRVVLWSGRIDNRKALYALLKSSTVRPLKELSDAELFNLLYQQGHDFLGTVIGPFAVVIVQSDTGEVFAARDPMGGRNLVYADYGDCVCLATIADAICALPGFEYRLNRQRVAQFFAFQYDNDEHTFFQDINAVLPGHYLQWRPDSAPRQTVFWSADPRRRLVYKNADDYAEHFRELFTAAVECRLTAAGSLASLTSGGWDSAPMTGVAAQLAGSRVVPISWVFERFGECDERQYSHALFEQQALTPIWVNCDTALPFNGVDYWPLNPDRPFDTPYRAKHTRAYAAMEKAGIHVALSGMAGDDLYAGTDLIAYEFILRRQWHQLKNELAIRRRYSASQRIFLKRHFFWYTRLWYAIGGPRRILPDFLTEQAAQWVGEIDNFLAGHSELALRPRQYDRLLGTYWPDALSTERFYARQHGVEVRYPFRDRRLVEFMLQIPSEQLVSGGVHRRVMRNALGQLMPSSLQQRRSKTSFLPLLKQGLSEKQTMIESLLRGKEWSQFVNLPPVDRESDQYLMVRWQAAYFEYWCNR